MAEQPPAESRYRAFLSYSHKDAAAAGRLHRRLEAYRMPQRLAGRMTARGPVPDRLWPIFRDREELPAATDLSETVRTALAQSDSLIVLCSHHAATSLWVAEEIETFRALHPDRPILAAILDGDPPDCFPAALRAFGTDGRSHEPLATDLRPSGDGAQLGLLKLVAGITGVGLDDLVQRDAARKVRRVTAVTGAALIAMLVMAALTWFALAARREAERQRAAAEGQIEFMLTDLRARLRGSVRIEIMAAVNRHALAYYDGQNLAGLSAQSLERRARLLHAMGEDERTTGNLVAALAAFREAHRITEEQLQRAPANPERIFAHAQSEYWLGSVDEIRGNYAAALAAYQRYRSQSERMNQLVPNNPRYLGELAYSESNLGSVNLNGLRRPRIARQHFSNSLRWFQHASRMQPSNRTWRVETADARAWIAGTWFVEGRYREARAERLEEQRLKLALLAEDPDNRDYLYATVIPLRSLARIDIELREFGRARPRLEQARSIMTRLLGLDPQNLIWRDQATKIELDWVQLFVATGHFPEARNSLAAARALIEGTERWSTAPSVDRDGLKRQIETWSGQLSAANRPRNEFARRGP